MKRFALLSLLVGVWWCGSRGTPAPGPGAPRVGSFNIEDFPKSPAQVQAAFAELAALDLDVVALQEITDPDAAIGAARAALGVSWRGAVCRTCPDHRLVILYDSHRLRLVETREHAEVALYRGARPALEARFADDHGPDLRVIAVHLKAGGDGGAMRDRQLQALRPIAAAARRSGDRVVIAGDFNATADSDRAAIAELAAASDMVWASRDLECTCYWQRRESCFGAALDHVLTSEPPASIDVGGHCARECQPGRRCPTYRQEVSDHCPLRVELR